MAPTLEKVFIIRAFFNNSETLHLGPVYTKEGPTRACAPIDHGTIEGSGIKATLAPGGSDWILVDPATGIGHIDVRLHARLEDGAALVAHYTGIIKMDEMCRKVLSSAPGTSSTKGGDHLWLITPKFETNSEKLKWVTENVFVGQGHWHVTDDGFVGFEYDIYKLVPG